MRFLKKFSQTARARSLPGGQRVYAIGDVHGCADLLDDLLERIRADDEARGPARTLLIFLGDLVDRGAQSREVVTRVKALCEEGRARLIKGNHEDLLIRAARGDKESARGFYRVGGLPTLLSYGIDAADAEAGSFADLATLMAERIPRDHVAFLDGGEDAIAIGDYLFVHAGVRPGVTLEEQDPHELRWIRDEFTSSALDHGHVVVHGHTISKGVVLSDNRIGVDTGAYATGRLSAVGLDGSDRWILTASREPASAG